MTLDIHFNAAGIHLVIVTQDKEGQVHWRDRSGSLGFPRLNRRMAEMTFSEVAEKFFPETGKKVLCVGESHFEKRALIAAEAVSYIAVYKFAKQETFCIDIGLENRIAYEMRDLTADDLTSFMKQVEDAGLSFMKFDGKDVLAGHDRDTQEIYIDPRKLSVIVENGKEVILKFENTRDHFKICGREMELIDSCRIQDEERKSGREPRGMQEIIDEAAKEKLEAFFKTISAAASHLTEVPNTVNRLFIQPADISHFIGYRPDSEKVPHCIAITLRGAEMGMEDIPAYFKEESHARAAAELLIKHATTPRPQPWVSKGMSGLSA